MPAISIRACATQPRVCQHDDGLRRSVARRSGYSIRPKHDETCYDRGAPDVKPRTAGALQLFRDPGRATPTPQRLRSPRVRRRPGGLRCLADGELEPVSATIVRSSRGSSCAYLVTRSLNEGSPVDAPKYRRASLSIDSHAKGDPRVANRAHSAYLRTEALCRRAPLGRSWWTGLSSNADGRTDFRTW